MEVVDMIQEIVAVLFKPIQFSVPAHPFVIAGSTDFKIIA